VTASDRPNRPLPDQIGRFGDGPDARGASGAGWACGERTLHRQVSIRCQRAEGERDARGASGADQRTSDQRTGDGGW